MSASWLRWWSNWEPRKNISKSWISNLKKHNLHQKWANPGQKTMHLKVREKERHHHWCSNNNNNINNIYKINRRAKKKTNLKLMLRRQMTPRRLSMKLKSCSRITERAFLILYLTLIIMRRHQVLAQVVPTLLIIRLIHCNLNSMITSKKSDSIDWPHFFENKKNKKL